MFILTLYFPDIDFMELEAIELSANQHKELTERINQVVEYYITKHNNTNCEILSLVKA